MAIGRISITLYGRNLGGSLLTQALNDGNPFELGLNDRTGAPYGPLPGEEAASFIGGAPFGEAAELASISRGLVTETLPLQIMGQDHNTCLASLRTLRRQLSTAVWATPLIVSFKPVSSTNTVYYEILQASVREDLATFLNLEDGKNVLRVPLTWTRQPYGTTANTTAFASLPATITNTAVAAANQIAMPTGQTGDRVYVGQPLNAVLSTFSDFGTSGIKQAWLGTIVAGAVRVTTRSDAISTASTTAIAVGSAWATNVNLPTGSQRVRWRGIARVIGTPQNLELRLVVTWTNSNGAPIWTSPWTTASFNPAGGAGVYVDCGGFTLPEEISRTPSNYGVGVAVQARAVTGTATGTLSALELVPYITWCSVASSLSYGSVSVIQTAANTIPINSYIMPFVSPVIEINSSGPLEPLAIRGAPPVVIENGALYVAWTNNLVHNAAATAVPSSFAYVPLYETLRGGG